MPSVPSTQQQPGSVDGEGNPGSPCRPTIKRRPQMRQVHDAGARAQEGRVERLPAACLAGKYGSTR